MYCYNVRFLLYAMPRQMPGLLRKPIEYQGYHIVVGIDTADSNQPLETKYILKML